MIFPPTTEGEIIYPKLYYWFDWLCWKRHHATQNSHPARLYPQSIRHACSKHSPSGKADGLNTLILPPRHACPGFNKRSHALHKDFAPTCAHFTEEFAHLQEQAHLLPCAGQIGNGACVMTVHTCRRTGAKGTASRWLRRDSRNDESILR